jgi:hypothetical protein
VRTDSRETKKEGASVPSFFCLRGSAFAGLCRGSAYSAETPRMYLHSRRDFAYLRVRGFVGSSFLGFFSFLAAMFVVPPYLWFAGAVRPEIIYTLRADVASRLRLAERKRKDNGRGIIQRLGLSYWDGNTSHQGRAIGCGTANTSALMCLRGCDGGVIGMDALGAETNANYVGRNSAQDGEVAQQFYDPGN